MCTCAGRAFLTSTTLFIGLFYVNVLENLAKVPAPSLIENNKIFFQLFFFQSIKLLYIHYINNLHRKVLGTRRARVFIQVDVQHYRQLFAWADRTWFRFHNFVTGACAGSFPPSWVQAHTEKYFTS